VPSYYTTSAGDSFSPSFFIFFFHPFFDLFFLFSFLSLFFYTQQQLLLWHFLAITIATILSVRESVRPSVRHTGGSVKNGASYDHQIFTVGCLEDFSFRNPQVLHKFERCSLKCNIWWQQF